MNYFLSAFLLLTFAFTKIYLFFAFIYYKKYGTIPVYLLNVSFFSIYYYSNLQLGFIKTQNMITTFVKSVPFLNNLLIYINSDKSIYTYTNVNEDLTICNKFNQEQKIDYKRILHYNPDDSKIKYIESLELEQANYNANQISQKAASIIENMQTSNQLFASIGGGAETASIDPSQILAPALAAISAMVLNVNEIDRTLREFANSPITIPATLNKLTHDILGTTTEYTVRPGNVNFHFNLEVSIDTKELKSALQKAGMTTDHQ